MAQVTISLSAACESVRYGYTASATDEPCGPRFLRITDIVPDSLNWETVPYCQIDDDDKKRYALAPGDIVVARTGATVGYAKLIRDEVDAVFASYLVRFRVDTNTADPVYVGRLVESQVYKSFVQSRVGGAAQPNASAPVLGGFEFVLPERRAQSRIASILSAYDDLIENNRRRMKLLEGAARQLYREWFMPPYRFPGSFHGRGPAAPSPGAKRHPLPGGEGREFSDLPQGWERKTLVDVAEVNRDSLSGSFNGEIEYIDIASVSPGRIDSTASFDFREAPSRARRIVVHGDIIWSCVRPNRRSYAVIWQPPVNLIASTGFAVITPRSLPTSYLFQATTTDAFVGYLNNRARGAAYPAVLASDFERAEILVPRSCVVKAYDELVEPMLAQAHALRLQTQKLRAARDLLLPKLMSGEVAV